MTTPVYFIHYPTPKTLVVRANSSDPGAFPMPDGWMIEGISFDFGTGNNSIVYSIDKGGESRVREEMSKAGFKELYPAQQKKPGALAMQK